LTGLGTLILPGIGTIAGCMIGSIGGAILFANSTSSVVGHVLDSIGHDIAKEKCFHCDEEFKIRKHKGENLETVHGECKEKNYSDCVISHKELYLSLFGICDDFLLGSYH
jgi:hypothetical protein